MTAMRLWYCRDGQQLLVNRMHRTAVEYQAHPDLVYADDGAGRVPDGLCGSRRLAVEVRPCAAPGAPNFVQFNEVFLHHIRPGPAHDLVAGYHVAGAGQQFVQLLRAAIPSGRHCESDAHGSFGIGVGSGMKERHVSRKANQGRRSQLNKFLSSRHMSFKAAAMMPGFLARTAAIRFKKNTRQSQKNMASLPSFLR